MPPSAPAPPLPPPPETLPPELRKYFDLLGGVENTSKALVLGENDEVLVESPVGSMIEALTGLTTPAKALVFDGIVSQRVVDVAQEKGIGTVVASRVGAVGKFPESVRVLTRADLGGGH
ncbi:TOPRIM domain protein [mine drainage metagenome]|uniref:TOPRIM domain protein n=1 Tax=mine drainage metagenome TaxID=410659 RepID=T1BFI0_9ZZZZ